MIQSNAADFCALGQNRDFLFLCRFSERTDIVKVLTGDGNIDREILIQARINSPRSRDDGRGTVR